MFNFIKPNITEKKDQLHSIQCDKFENQLMDVNVGTKTFKYIWKRLQNEKMSKL